MQLKVGLAFGALCLTAVAIPQPAMAVGYGNPVIQSPADGSTLNEGWTGLFTVDFTDAPLDTYDVDVQCTNYSWSDSWTYDGNTNYHTWTVPALHDDHYVNSTDSCEIDVVSESNPSLFSDTVFVDVKPNPLKLSNASASLTTFYPVVADGYEDTTKVSYRMSRDATVTAAVLDSTGAPVRSDSLGQLQGGNRAYTWDGKDNSGVAVSPGTYRVVLSARTTDGTTSQTSTQVTAAIGWQSRTYAKSIAGARVTSSQATSKCSARKYYRSLRMVCSGIPRAHETATWRFAIPADAYGLAWSVSGARVRSDHPRRGVITKSGSRPSKTSFCLKVTVTYQRAYDVDTARITWKRDIRI